MTEALYTPEAVVYGMAVIRGKVPAPDDVKSDAKYMIDDIAQDSPYLIKDFRRTSWLPVALLYSVGGIDLVEDYLDIATDPEVEQEYDFLLFCIVTRNGQLCRRYDALDVNYKRDPLPRAM